LQTLLKTYMKTDYAINLTMKQKK